MNRRLYIHGGMQKAGSKSIQSFSASETDLLGSRRLRYATTGRDGIWHRPVYEAAAEHIRALGREADETQRDLLISYEEMYLWPDAQIRGIQSVFDQVELFVVRRSFTPWLNSFVNQMIKAHLVTAEEIDEALEKPSALARRADVDHHVERWRLLLGDNAVVVADYPEAGSGDVLQSFADWLDVNFDGVPNNLKNPNPAADLHSLSILLEVKRIVADEAPGLLRAAMSEAHSALAARWLDTRSEAGPQLVSSQACNDLLMARSSTSGEAKPIDLSELRDRLGASERAMANMIVSVANQRET